MLVHERRNGSETMAITAKEIAPLVIKARDGSQRTFITDEKVEDKAIPPLPEAKLTERKICISEEDGAPLNYGIDTNGNVKMKITLPAISYKWYVLRKPSEES